MEFHLNFHRYTQGYDHNLTFLTIKVLELLDDLLIFPSMAFAF